MTPNVLCIVLDTARADALEPYGAAPGASPAIADFARTGMVVEQARATSCWTLPSHASMFTGALPRGLGLGQAPAATPQSAAPVLRAEEERMLPQVLRRSGYATAAVSTNVWVSPLSGFEVGFDRFEQIDSTRQKRLDGGRRDRLGRLLEAGIARVDDGAAEAGRVLDRWIGEHDGDPFFWFVNVVECHSPYLPPRPYQALSLRERLRAAEEARQHLNLEAIWRICASEFDIPEDALDRMRRLYAGAVRYVDHWLEGVLGGLERAGILDETLVIITSDHGENFGEGGLITHAFSLDDRLIRVPLIVAGPGADAFEGISSLAELPARVARAVGVSDHPWHERGLDDGVAVAQWDPPGPASDPRVQWLVDRWGADQGAARRFGSTLTCATSGRLKLQRRDDVEELFDLDSDPLELEPIHSEEEKARRAGEVLGTLREALRNPTVLATVEHDAEEASAEEIEEIEDRMRLLGYM